MSKWDTAEVATPAHLDELIEEATVDCYDEEAVHDADSRRRGLRSGGRDG